MGKRKGSKKGKEKKAKPLVDGIEVKEMSRPQLYGHCKRLQDEIRKEIDERNRFMLERERYYLLWQLVMERVDMQKDKLDLMKSHMEDTLKEKNAQDAAYEQKLRFLKSEQSKKLGEVRLFHLERMKMVQDDAWNLQMIMRDALLCKKSAIRKAQMSLFEIMRSLHLKHGKDLSEMRRKFCEEIRLLETSFNRRLFELNDKEDEVQEEVLSQIVTVKEDQFKAMCCSHELQMKDMKSFFNELTVNNLALIAKMELELRLSKENEIRLRREEASLLEALNSVADPINKANTTIKEWEIMDEGLDALEMEKDLKTLLKSKGRLKRQAKMMEYSNEALIQRISIAEKERDDLRKSFSHAIVDMQRKSSMKRLVTALQRKAALREAELFQAVSSNLEDPKGDIDHYKLILDKRDEKLKGVLELVTEAATDFKTTYDIYSGAYKNNVISLDEIGFPLTKSGAKPREEEEKPIMIFDTKGNKHRNRPIHGQTSTAPVEGVGDGAASEDASKSSMTSSQHTTSEIHPGHMPMIPSASKGRRKSDLKTGSSRVASSKPSRNARQGPSVASSQAEKQAPRRSIENISEKFSEHLRQHKKQKSEVTSDEENSKKKNVKTISLHHPSNQNHEPPVVVLKSAK